MNDQPPEPVGDRKPAGVPDLPPVPPAPNLPPVTKTAGVSNSAPPPLPGSPASPSSTSTQTASWLDPDRDPDGTPPKLFVPTAKAPGGERTDSSPDHDTALPRRDQHPAADRRPARRRPAGPSRERVAANDDVPSIGGLIYALNQKPSNQPFVIASAASGLWAAIVIAFAATFFGNEISRIGTLAGVIQRPELLTVIATLVAPILVIWFLAFLIWRTEELRLRSTAMTEVAIRLAEPDRMAEQQVASLGQAVRRQVAFMNEAVERALGRAGELEALVHKEVAELEHSYEDNERKIRNLIGELAGERTALLTTSGSVTETLESLGKQMPQLIDRLSSQQRVLSEIIDGASHNLTALETAIATQTGNLEHALGSKTQELQVVFEEYTSALGTALEDRTEQVRTLIEDQRTSMDTTLTARTGEIQSVFEEYTSALGTALEDRTEQVRTLIEDQRTSMDTTLTARTGEIQSVFEEYTRALDTSLANRAEALDMHLVARTRALDEAFSQRLNNFESSLQRSTNAIDSTISEKAIALNAAMEHHAKSLGAMLGNQAAELDESLMQGIHAVRLTSENITRQSLQAIEGLSRQSELLTNISENLLSQIHGVTSRFENQGQNILRAANALESANYKIDNTLQARNAELERTLETMSSRANMIGSEFQGYSSQLQGSMSEVEKRAHLLTSEITQTAQEQSRAVLDNIQRLKQAATEDTSRAIEDLRTKFSSVSDEMTSNLNHMSSRVSEASFEARRTTAEAASALEREQHRLREQIARLPAAARDGSEAMHQTLRDQLRALEQLSQLSAQQTRQRDVTRPMPRHSGDLAHPSGGFQQGGGALPPPSREVRPQPAQPQKELASLGATFSREMRAHHHGQPPQATPPHSATPAAPGSENWSLGDLLKRASLDDDAAPSMAGPIDIACLARAVDPNTASAVWARLGAGQSGIMVRSIYTPDGRLTFDESSSRYRQDPAYQHSVNTYIADFERLLEDAEAKDQSGRTGQEYLLSDLGRAYLVLAHATGRIA